MRRLGYPPLPTPSSSRIRYPGHRRVPGFRALSPKHAVISSLSPLEIPNDTSNSRPTGCIPSSPWTFSIISLDTTSVYLRNKPLHETRLANSRNHEQEDSVQACGFCRQGAQQLDSNTPTQVLRQDGRCQSQEEEGQQDSSVRGMRGHQGPSPETRLEGYGQPQRGKIIMDSRRRQLRLRRDNNSMRSRSLHGWLLVPGDDATRRVHVNCALQTPKQEFSKAPSLPSGRDGCLDTCGSTRERRKRLSCFQCIHRAASRASRCK